jgi:hypothetical protein
MKSTAFFLVGVGCSWAAVVVWIYLALSGITEPVSTTAVFLYFGSQLIGPMAMVVGSVFVLTGKFARNGTILSSIGCVILTGFVLYQVWSVAQPAEPLEFRPFSNYVIHGVFLVITITSDFAAYRIYRLVAKREASEQKATFR